MVDSNVYLFAKYSIIWVISYLSFTYAPVSNFSLNHVDVALVASIVTLLFCIFDNFARLTAAEEYANEYMKNIKQTEHMENSSPNTMIGQDQKINPRAFSKTENLMQIGTGNGKTRDDLLTNEMVYSDFNRLPPSSTPDNFEYGYSFLPPKDWYPIPPYPPVCVTSTPATVCPIMVDREAMELKEWKPNQKITPPDTINTEFIANELNGQPR